jgi:hypothetical protein
LKSTWIRPNFSLKNINIDKALRKIQIRFSDTQLMEYC